jgi:hypothetical protein
VNELLAVQQAMSSRALWLFVILVQALSCWAVRETRFYKLLGVAPDAAEDAIKKGYRKAALCASM